MNNAGSNAEPSYGAALSGVYVHFRCIYFYRGKVVLADYY